MTSMAGTVAGRIAKIAMGARATYRAKGVAGVTKYAKAIGGYGLKRAAASPAGRRVGQVARGARASYRSKGIAGLAKYGVAVGKHGVRKIGPKAGAVGAAGLITGYAAGKRRQKNHMMRGIR